MTDESISVVIPAKNEQATIAAVVARVASALPGAEIIVVDDGSTDATATAAREAGAIVLSSPYPMGNGAAVKRGARAARGSLLVFLDADGQHDPHLIGALLDPLGAGYDMVVGARDWSGQAGVGRGVANSVYNWMATWITGHRIVDLTSGFRAVRAELFREFLHLLPNGFSYPTTITMAFFRNAYPVAYRPIPVARRIGASHIRPLQDGLRFLMIIFKIATLYAPLKVFAPLSFGFALLGLANYAYTYFSFGRFTNMSAVLLSAAVVVFLIGLMSEQITSISYGRARSQRGDGA